MTFIDLASLGCGRYEGGENPYSLVEDIVVPSRAGDYKARLGTKHAPLTQQIEFSKVIYYENLISNCFLNKIRIN